MKVLLLLSLLISLLFSQSDMDIDSYIAKIQEASPDERVALMNEFKRKVAQMNKEERLNSIKKMQIKMVQEQHNNEITTYQNMNHSQVAKQLVDVGNKIGIAHKEHR
jgi:hypothetical protein